MSAFIELKNVKKIYRMGKEKVAALRGISFSIEKNEIVMLLGPSGSGKSTLLNLMAGLEKPSQGEIIIAGKGIQDFSEEKITKFRQLNVGFVFQSYNLIPTLDAMENVSLGLTFRGAPKREREIMSKEILEACGLGTRLHHKPNEMSGGQQQRVSIARAFVDKPKIVFCDEPTGNLDTRTTAEIMDLITGMAKKYNQTLIIVTHNDELKEYAHRIIHIRDGLVENIEVKPAV